MQPALLIVEDDPMLCRALVRTIKRDHPVFSAHSAKEAISILENNPTTIGAVLADYFLPGMRGDSLLKQIHDNYPQIGCLLMTADVPTLTHFETLVPKPHFVCIRKPFVSIDDFKKKISQSLSVFESNNNLS